MMNSSCTVDYGDSSLQLFSLITYIPICFFGTIFNITALWIFFRKLPKRTETTVFLMNLMVADMLIVLTLPFRIYSILNEWNLGPKLCMTLTIFYFINTYVSIFTISAIAFDRYLALNHPLKYRGCMSPKKALIMCSSFWIFCLAVGILRKVLGNSLRYPGVCFVKVSLEPSKMTLAYSGIGFFLPLLFIGFCTGKIMKNLRVNVQMNAKEQSTFRKAVNIIISNFVVFVFCFLPLHVGYIIRYIAESQHAPCHTIQSITVFIHVATVFANSNCVLDTVCYYFAATEFRNALSKQSHSGALRST